MGERSQPGFPFWPSWGLSRNGVKNYSKRARWSRNRQVPLGMMSTSRRRAASGRRSLSGRRLDLETTSSTTRTSCQRRRSRNSRSCRSLHPDRVLMRCRNAGVEADARERADLAFGVAKNPIARVSILARFSGPSRGRFRHGHNLYPMAMPWQSFSRPKPRRTGASHIAEAVSGITPGGSHTDP